MVELGANKIEVSFYQQFSNGFKQIIENLESLISLKSLYLPKNKIK